MRFVSTAAFYEYFWHIYNVLCIHIFSFLFTTVDRLLECLTKGKTITDILFFSECDSLLINTQRFNNGEEIFMIDTAIIYITLNR
uniref:Secreted protein n=1 Tax=Ascaris lumbricoides TaxID=6252 RepID=A0A9J2PP22_ASCLU